MATAHVFTTTVITIRDASRDVKFEIQFEEHTELYCINGGVLEGLIKAAARFSNSGAAIDALHIAADKDPRAAKQDGRHDWTVKK